MSASREKQTRKDRTAAGEIAPKTAREAQQRKEERRSNFLYGLIGVAFVVVVVISIIWNSNILTRSATAVTVDGQKYNAAQVNFYYRNAYLSFMNQWSSVASYFGLDPSLPLDTQEIGDTAASFLSVDLSEYEDGLTWKEYFLSQALEQMADVQNGLKEASETGFQFPQSVQDEYDESLEALGKSARSAGVNVRRYLQASFGSMMTESVYKTELLKLMRFGAYADAYQDGLTYTPEELDAEYNENQRDYDFVAYEGVSVDGSLTLEKDDEGNDIPAEDGAAEAAKNSAKIAADALAAGVREGGSLSALSANMDKTSAFSGDKESYENATYTSEEFADWLFDPERKANDVDVIENGDIYYVVKFLNRFRDESKTIDVRHILIQPEEGELAEGDEGYQEEHDLLLAQAKAKAEELYQRWKDGDATEESFAALVSDNSDDPGSRDEGGLYERVAAGEMMTEFNDWCFDPSRQPGDTDIVQTDSGYHIMYFVGDNELSAWQAQVYDKLQSDAYTEWSDGLHENADIQRVESGLKRIE